MDKKPFSLKELYQYFRLRLKAIEHERDSKILTIIKHIEERQIKKLEAEIRNNK